MLFNDVIDCFCQKSRSESLFLVCFIELINCLVVSGQVMQEPETEGGVQLLSGPHQRLKLYAIKWPTSDFELDPVFGKVKFEPISKSSLGSNSMFPNKY